MSVNAWIVRAARRAATLDAAHQLAGGRTPGGAVAVPQGVAARRLV